jgi:hypothetical protein
VIGRDLCRRGRIREPWVPFCGQRPTAPAGGCSLQLAMTIARPRRGHGGAACPLPAQLATTDRNADVRWNHKPSENGRPQPWCGVDVRALVGWRSRVCKFVGSRSAPRPWPPFRRAALLFRSSRSWAPRQIAGSGG